MISLDGAHHHQQELVHGEMKYIEKTVCASQSCQSGGSPASGALALVAIILVATPRMRRRSASGSPR